MKRREAIQILAAAWLARPTCAEAESRVMVQSRAPELLIRRGRIVNADGVRTVAMVYDAEGRVVAQTSATGFTTRFDYDPVRRTTLSDPDYNPLSVYTHDERGRVEIAGDREKCLRFEEPAGGQIRQPAGAEIAAQ